MAEAALSSAEQARFWEDGWLVINDLFSEAEVAEMRVAIESPEIAEAARNAGLEYQTVHCSDHRTASAVPGAGAGPADRRAVDELIGPDIQLQHSKLAARRARRRRAASTGTRTSPSSRTPTRTSSPVMVMLDHATEENGCMHMVRGSHRLGPLDHAQNGRFTGACQQPEHWEAHPERVAAVTPRAGGISIHHCLTLHGSGPNPSGLPRRGVVFQYRAMTPTSSPTPSSPTPVC
jgi:nucleotide-binding universal stress UspA family protein